MVATSCQPSENETSSGMLDGTRYEWKAIKSGDDILCVRSPVSKFNLISGASATSGGSGVTFSGFMLNWALNGKFVHVRAFPNGIDIYLI